MNSAFELRSYPSAMLLEIETAARAGLAWSEADGVASLAPALRIAAHQLAQWAIACGGAENDLAGAAFAALERGEIRLPPLLARALNRLTGREEARAA